MNAAVNCLPSISYLVSGCYYTSGEILTTMGLREIAGTVAQVECSRLDLYATSSLGAFSQRANETIQKIFLKTEAIKAPSFSLPELARKTVEQIRSRRFWAATFEQIRSPRFLAAACLSMIFPAAGLATAIQLVGATGEAIATKALYHNPKTTIRFEQGKASVSCVKTEPTLIGRTLGTSGSETAKSAAGIATELFFAFSLSALGNHVHADNPKLSGYLYKTAGALFFRRLIVQPLLGLANKMLAEN